MTGISNQKTWGVLLLVFLLLGSVNIVKADDNGPKEPFIKVTGEGKVTAIPDQAEMEFQVQEDGPKLEEVSAEVRTRMKNVFKVIKDFGIQDKDFQTVSYTIEPKYKYDKNDNVTQRIGYTVSNRVRVVLKDIDKTGEILEAIAKAGISEIDGPNFGFSDPEKLNVEALAAAVANAHDKAEALAKASDSDLGKVYSINQTSAYEPRAYLGMAVAANAEKGEVPIAKGQDEVTAQVEVVYLLK